MNIKWNAINYQIQRNGKQLGMSDTLLHAIFELRSIHPEADLRQYTRDLDAQIVRRYKDSEGNKFEIFYLGAMK